MLLLKGSLEEMPTHKLNLQPLDRELLQHLAANLVHLPSVNLQPLLVHYSVPLVPSLLKVLASLEETHNNLKAVYSASQTQTFLLSQHQPRA